MVSESWIKPAAARAVAALQIWADLLTEQVVFFACEFALIWPPLSKREEKNTMLFCKKKKKQYPWLLQGLFFS